MSRFGGALKFVARKFLKKLGWGTLESKGHSGPHPDR